MKIKDVEKGMKVECQTDNPKGTGSFKSPIKKGDILTVSEIKKASGGINFEEEKAENCLWYPQDFEPANKFEVGELILYEEKDVCNSYFYRGKILFIADKTDDYNNKYMIEIYRNGGEYTEYLIEGEQFIKKRKKRNELKVGDKFRINETFFKVLAVGYDDYHNCKSYFSKIISGNHEGQILTRLSTNINEIIYN